MGEKQLIYSIPVSQCATGDKSRNAGNVRYRYPVLQVPDFMDGGSILHDSQNVQVPIHAAPSVG
jgi:hypothetical protein